MPSEDAATREQKAYRRVTAAARKLAKQHSISDLGEAVASANHQDTSTRAMRRTEALADLLEALVTSGEESDAKPEAKTTSKRVKAADHESAQVANE